MHQTDYDNLNSFDCALVFAIAAGVALLGAIVYVGLPAAAQADVASAVSILDISQQSTAFIEDAKLVFDFSKQYMDEFYLAFSEVAVIPAEYIESFTEYSDAIAQIYQSNNIALHEGSVAGAYWDLTPLPAPSAPADLSIPYEYSQPELKAKINFLNINQ